MAIPSRARFSPISFRQISALALIAIMILATAPSTLAAKGVKHLAESLMHAVEAARTTAARLASEVKQRNPGPNRQNRGMPEAPPSSTSASPRRAQTRAEREGKIWRLAFNTDDNVELQSGRHLQLAAIPVDIDGNAIHGLVAKWQSSNPEVVAISDNGEAVAGIPGAAQITATAGLKNNRINITVTPAVASPAELNENDPAIKSRAAKTSRSSIPVRVSKRAGREQSTARLRQDAHRSSLPVAFMPQGQGRDPDAFYSASNAVGTPPNKTTPGAKTRAAATACGRLQDLAAFPL